jgi:formiminotetrahydrofolate cyclodeaminase
MHPMSNMLTLNYRKSQKNGTRRKIEMSNMLIEKERERKEEKNENIKKKLRLLQRRDNAAYEQIVHSILKFIFRLPQRRDNVVYFPFATTKR